MSVCCTVSEITTYLRTRAHNDIEKYFRSNAAVEVIAQASVVISFVGNI